MEKQCPEAGQQVRSILNSEPQTVAVGITPPFSCSYFAERQEQLIVIQQELLQLPLYERLLAMGFRRSGEAVYRPHCPGCQACQSLRIPLADFKPSQRQKRTLAHNQDLDVRITDSYQDAHYALYDRYIRTRHQDGSMYPPSLEQYQHFLSSQWLQPRFIELLLHGQLVGVAVTDVLPNSLSAVYSYFDPDMEKRSLGSMMILTQCRLAQEWRKQYLYLGYQIDNHPKMDYKRLYRPYEILTEQGWEKSDCLASHPLHTR
ncbi:arginyltransferase [Shewanella yunxiaonensis]|uniref:Aspartate/glutamate leucyltransferase n=1 Tax=Shewanella yunxiaonensis TaxID=2829809 RepID=A0ABX7YY41_9GAMM|nr:arginyltransferase [Shewanella yunxiaonensis]